MSEDSRPLPTLAGGTWMPGWAPRWKRHRPLQHLPADAMQLWCTMHSFSLNYGRPLCVSRTRLAASSGMSPPTVTRRLALLVKASLVFEVKRYDPSGDGRRTTARWAPDPLEADRWRPKIEKGLERLWQRDGQDRFWLSEKIKDLDRFERKARKLGNAIFAETIEDWPQKARERETAARSRKSRRNSRQAKRQNLKQHRYRGLEKAPYNIVDSISTLRAIGASGMDGVEDESTSKVVNE